MIGPSLPFCDFLHQTKYRSEGETYEGFTKRFAKALADDQYHYTRLLRITESMRFMAAGRVQAWAGSPKVVTPYNCFVSATINDSFVDAPDISKGEPADAVSIMDAAKMSAQTMRLGGGIGYAFDTLRPEFDMIVGVRASTSGPIGFMPIYNAIGVVTSSAGDRRGAQMGVMRCDHPDILKFITMKANNDFLNGFNTSVGITDEFMEAVARNGTFDLRFGGRVYKTVDAREMWDLIMRNTWDWAEPGVLFLDSINRMNNLYYCEKIAATNPCAEQPLPPYGACLLGSFNLVKYLDKDLYGFYFNWDQFKADISDVVRALDNVIDKAKYPLPQQKKEAQNKRRMGMGITGLANALEAMGYPYGTIGFTTFQNKVQAVLRDEAYRASITLAKEKGSFPLFDADKYRNSEFIKTLPDDIRYDIHKFGVRNSHLLSIAPTGTISFTADNVSSSIEPVFSIETERPVDLPGGKQVVNVKDYGYQFLGVKGKTTAEVTVDEHVSVLLTASGLVDSAVSKTVNVDKHVEWKDFVSVYQKAYEGGAKGCTTFNKDGKRFGLLKDLDSPESVPDSKIEACTWDPLTGKKTCE